MDGSVLFPEHRVRPGNQRRNVRVGTGAGCPDGLAPVVDRESDADGVAFEKTQFADLTGLRPPYDGLKVENLGPGAVGSNCLWALRIAYFVLCIAGDLTEVVDSSEAGVDSA